MSDLADLDLRTDMDAPLESDTSMQARPTSSSITNHQLSQKIPELRKVTRSHPFSWNLSLKIRSTAPAAITMKDEGSGTEIGSRR